MESGSGRGWDCISDREVLFQEGGNGLLSSFYSFLAGGVLCQQLCIHADRILNTVVSVKEWVESISQGKAISKHSTKMKMILP